VPSIDLVRLKGDLQEFARIGYEPADGGIYRPGFSQADISARRAFLSKLNEEGFEARMDVVGNVIGRVGPADTPCIMIGSHLDSVPAGGFLDGALGALAGLECLRQIRGSDLALGYAVEVVATAEEEGRFGGMLGSQAITGTVDPEWLAAARDGHGTLLTQAMRDAGLDPERIGEAARRPEDIRAFLELHIEQGPVLEHRGIPIGIVEGISGCFNWQIRLEGQADHAGTTPMDMRRDALCGASEFIAGIDAMIAEAGTADSRVTVGQLDVLPNFAHTVAQTAAFTIIGRDMTGRAMDGLEAAIRIRLEAIAERRGLALEITEVSRLEPAECSAEIRETMAKAASARGYDYLAMPCGAGHDAQTMSAICSSGLIFVPSRGGISHSPEEWTDWTDIEKGANLLLDTALTLAAR